MTSLLCFPFKASLGQPGCLFPTNHCPTPRAINHRPQLAAMNGERAMHGAQSLRRCSPTQAMDVLQDWWFHDDINQTKLLRLMWNGVWTRGGMCISHSQCQDKKPSQSRWFLYVYSQLPSKFHGSSSSVSFTLDLFVCLLSSSVDAQKVCLQSLKMENRGP